ncbi:Alpha/beta-hydrolase [Pleurostoma richardsiae]|uniref:Alpha/beta-hydrolase n=1 Tax=Pleurostoma richardsiae TaxID=41990 RepID=A0AA38RSN9_9PEZI|nr:Alpha/beta-hydrolase [Pleurostoma richardsiae]
MGVAAVLQSSVYAVAVSIAGYFAFVSILAIPAVQNQAIYLNRVTLTWFKDVNYPEQWGFLHNQVTPFRLETPDGESLHAWHILPLEVYRRNEQHLIKEPAGLAVDITSRESFRLLRDDPDALLVLYFHGAAGTLGSGFRPPSYRAMYAGAPDKIHTIAIDYRGFGTSTGSPSENGLLTDAVTLADWAMNVAGVPPSRIVLFAQSLGTAVAISLARHMASRPDPVLFAGMVLVAPFVDVELLTATYRLAGTIPILDPVARFPRLLAFLNSFIGTKWPSKDTIADLVRRCEGAEGDGPIYDITILHAEDDYDIPWVHSEQVFWHAVDASLSRGISYEALEQEKAVARTDLGEGGWMVTRRTGRGTIREHILKHGLHDRIMSYPAVSLAILRAFHSRDTE